MDIFFILVIPAADESQQQPLLDPIDENPPEPSAIQPTQPSQPVSSAPAPVTTQSAAIPRPGIVSQMKQTFSNRFTMATTHSNSSSVRYSPVYKTHPETHVEELNFRLKALNERDYSNSNENDNGAVGGQAIPSDINPSVGSDTEKESELNIGQLESSVSSLSGLPSGSSTVHSPETVQNRRHAGANWRIEHYETDF